LNAKAATVRGEQIFDLAYVLHDRKSGWRLAGAPGWKFRKMPNLTSLHPGLAGTSSITVAPEHTAPHVGSGRVPVLATPVMINVIEAAALSAIEHLLPEGHQSLGIHLDVRHFAATPVGLSVTARAEVIAVEGRTITFRVEARDEREAIGDGTHQRVIVNVARFDERVQRKTKGGG
jgi:predicted thioesterase